MTTVLLVLTLALTQAAPTHPDPPTAREIAADTYLVPGAMLPDRGPDGNTVIVVGPSGLIVIDTGRHPWHSDGILAFARRTRLPVAVIVNEAMLKAANHLFHDSTAPNRFATLFFARCDDATGELACVNCGHNPPLLLRANGDAEWLSPTATALGFFGEWRCATLSRRLGPGDLLVMDSDGITQAWSADGSEYGEVRLLDVVRTNRFLPAQELATRIVADVKAFSTLKQSDDWTLIAASARRG